jgi:hypothetical protein
MTHQFNKAHDTPIQQSSRHTNSTKVMTHQLIGVYKMTHQLLNKGDDRSRRECFHKGMDTDSSVSKGFDKEKCAQTSHGKPGWFSIDLGQTRAVTAVKIADRGDGGSTLKVEYYQ